VNYADLCGINSLGVWQSVCGEGWRSCSQVIHYINTEPRLRVLRLRWGRRRAAAWEERHNDALQWVAFSCLFSLWFSGVTRGGDGPTI